MKNKEIKTTKKKNFLNKLASEIKNLHVEEIIYVLLIVTGVLVLLGIIGKRDILSVYFARMMPPPIYYFDLVVRNGVLKWIYFALVIAVIYWLAKKTLKKKFTLPLKAVAIITGLVIAYLIYLVPPYYTDEVSPLPGSFWPYPKENEIFRTNHSRCGDTLDFIFSPSSKLGLKVLPVIQKLRDEGMPINMYCIGDTWINDNIVCMRNYNLDPAMGEKRRNELGVGKGGFSKEGVPTEPLLVIGCEYYITARHNVTVTREFICNKTDIC